MGRRLLAEAVAGTVVIVAVGCNALSGVDDLAICSSAGCDDASVPPITSTSSSTGSGTSTSSSSSGVTSSSSGTTTSSSSSSSSSGMPTGCNKPEPGLVAYYPLDETGTATTVLDCSGHGHNGTVISAGTWGAGKFGGGFTTGDNAGCIDLGTPAELLLESASFTVAVWGKAAAFPTAPISYYLVGRTALPQNAGWRLGSDPGQWTAKFFDTAKGVTLIGSATPQPTDTWTHVAATFSKDNVATIYINGVAAGSTPYSAVLPDMSTGVRIGCRGDDKAYLHGTVDEVRIYDRVLDATEITALAAKTP